MTAVEPRPAVDVSSGALGGPPWLTAYRRSALGALAETPYPSSAEEDWRYGRIDDLDPTAFAPIVDLASSPAVARELAAPTLEAIGGRGGLLLGIDGGISEVELDPSLAAEGVRLDRLVSLADEPAYFGRRIAEQADAFTHSSDALVRDAAVVDVPAGVRVPRPIVIVHAVSPEADGHACFPRTVIRLGKHAEATIVELLVSAEGRALVVPVTEITLADGAHGTYLGAQELGRAAWHLGYLATEAGRSATLRCFSAAFGGDYARHWSRTTLVGEGADSELLAVYLGDGDQVEEFRTFQEHVAPRTRSELVFKGAVAGRAHSVYTGLITMHKGARRADAAQTNRNLVLSEDAEAFSVPNLDIQENDVRCSHASAVGPIDREQRFYLESRGVPSEVAERLILLGFFEDLLARSPHAGFAEHLRTLITSRLGTGAVL